MIFAPAATPSVTADVGQKIFCRDPRPSRDSSSQNVENPWQVLAKEMGVGEFVGSRAKRIAVKINPMTECITDEECMAEVDEKAEHFRCVDIPRRRVAATPRPLRGYSVETALDSAAAATWTFSGTTPQPRRRYAAETSRDAAAATWIRRGDESRRRRGHDVDIPRETSARLSGSSRSRRSIARRRCLELCSSRSPIGGAETPSRAPSIAGGRSPLQEACDYNYLFRIRLTLRREVPTSSPKA